MDKQYRDLAPLGRLHDPLPQLARRVHTALLIREKTVWVDNNGCVFATPTDLLRTISPHATIGLYAKWTPLPTIELGLRRALRERASAWIVDWKATYAQGARAGEHPGLRISAPRKRKRAAAPDSGQASRAQPRT